MLVHVFLQQYLKILQNDEVFVANRGTLISDLSDIHAKVDIVNSGVPQEQVVDLYDYFKELVTPETEKYQKSNTL
jgi:hydroxymethylpyrimidine pyrophosphatase-like HAD family hydrolase